MMWCLNICSKFFTKDNYVRGKFAKSKDLVGSQLLVSALLKPPSRWVVLPHLSFSPTR